MNRTMFTVLALGTFSTAAFAALQSQTTTSNLVQVGRSAPIALVVKPDGTRVAQTIAVACCDPKARDAQQGSTTVSVVVRTGNVNSSASATTDPIVIERSGSVAHVSARSNAIASSGGSCAASSPCGSASASTSGSCSSSLSPCTGTVASVAPVAVVQNPSLSRFTHAHDTELPRDGQRVIELRSGTDDDSDEPMELAEVDGDLFEEALEMPDFPDAGTFEMVTDDEDSADAVDADSITSALDSEMCLQGALESARGAQESMRGALESARGAREDARKAYEEAMEQHREALAEQREAIQRARESVRGVFEAPQARSHAGGSAKVRVYTTNPEGEPKRVQLFSAESKAPSADGGLAERVEALERIAHQRGFEARTSEASLEDRVAELERFMKSGESPKPAQRSQLSWKSPAEVRATSPFTVFTAPTLPPAAPRAPVAAAPAHPRTPRVAIGAPGQVFTRRAPAAAKVRVENSLAAPSAPAAPSEAPTPSAAAPATPDVPPAISAESEARRADIERAMNDLRAQAEALRAEMAKMRAKIDELPRNER